MKMNQQIPKLSNVEQINTQQIQRRAAKTSVSFIEMLEKQHGYDDDLDSLSLASSNGSDYMKSKNKDLDFLNSSGYLNEKKERRRKLRRKKKSSKNKKKNKSSSKVHNMSSFDMPSIEYDGDSEDGEKPEVNVSEVKRYTKLASGSLQDILRIGSPILNK